VKYTFFKAAREWRFLEAQTKEDSRKEFLETIEKQTSVKLSFFSLVGIRGDTDFMVLASSTSLDPFQSLVSGLLSTQLGRYLEIPYSYLAMTRRSYYIGSHKHADQEGTGEEAPFDSRFLFVYPFVKKREWYKLSFVERQRMMAEHLL